jgi:endonuclease-8
MPEGDTIFRTARTLHSALAGRVVTRFEAVLPMLARVDDQEPIVGKAVVRVRAVGKHLFIHFEGGRVLRTHMRMNGSWHLYRPGEQWWRPRADMRIVIETDAYVAVAFNVPVAEFGDGDVAHLGPDILGDSFDMPEALRRVRERNGEEIASVLLNQTIVAGIGNIWKSESLFLAGVDPFRQAGELDDATVVNILTIARKLMQASASPDARRARRSVYARGGEPCRRCGTAVSYRKQGLDARGTYWCSKCQPKS